MGIFSAARAALLAVSAYQPHKPTFDADFELDSPAVEKLRKMFGGHIAQPAISRSRWYLADLELAERLADGGKMSLVGQLMSWARRDGVLAGVLSTRTDGLVRLPKHFRGDDEIVGALEVGHDADGDHSVRSVFDEMCPPSELALLAGDGETCGVGVAELVPVEGRDYPVLTRLDPQFLEYVWFENRWYYRATIGRLPITPGDGRWVLHIPGGRVSPWANAKWRCLAQAIIRKTLAQWNKDAWENKLAHPARVAVAPSGASEPQTQAWFKAVMAWGVNTVFGVRPGYDVKLVEGNGRGYDSFNKTIDQANREVIIAIAGQEVTVDGGSGFINSDLFKTIRSDLIQSTADQLAHTVNTQIIPAFIVLRWGDTALETMACVMEWDVTPPKDRNSEATALTAAAGAINSLSDALKPHGIVLDVNQMCLRFAIPLKRPAALELDASGKPKLRLIQGGEGGDTLQPVDTLPGDTAAQDTALSGGQITSLVQVVQSVANGQIPRDAAIGILKRAFLVDDAGAAELLGSAGEGFVPKTDAPAPPAPAPPVPSPANTETEAA